MTQEIKPTGKDVVCVIVSYWPERADNLATICGDILAGTEVPRRIIIINNNSTWRLHDRVEAIFQDERISLVDSDFNFTSRSKYGVAMLEPSPYYLLLDDDISVNPGLLKRFLSFAKPGCCFSNWGVSFKGNYASAGSQVKAVDLDYSSDPVPVDIFIGIVQFLSFESIVKMFELESKVRINNLPKYRSVAEDMLIAQAQGPGGAHVVPVDGLDAPKQMHLGTESMQGDWGYYQFRDAFSFYVRQFTGHAIDENELVPGEPDYDQIAIEKYLDTLNDREDKYGKQV